MVKLARPTRSRDVDYRLLIPLLFNTVAVQMAVSTTRITTTYRAIELDLSVVWLGVISAAFALVPIVLAVQVGRFIDRGHDAEATWIGGGFLLLACVGFALWSSAVGLFVCTSVLGIGQMFLIAGQQMVCMRCAGPRHFESVLGNYMVANSIGQGLGPYLVGWVGGGARVPPTQSLFMIAVVAGALAFAFALAIRRSTDAKEKASSGEVMSVRELLRVRGFYAVLMLSVISVTSQDLVVVYLPLLGTERGIGVNDIGVLLTMRAIFSMISRLLYSRIVVAVGRQPLMVASTLAATLAFLALALPIPLAAMAFATALMGFSIGLSTTLSITSVMTLASAGARGTANSLRIVGNRLGQLVLPFGAGLVAAATGVAGIFVILAAGLAASAAAVHVSRPGQ